MTSPISPNTIIVWRGRRWLVVRAEGMVLLTPWEAPWEPVVVPP